MVITYVAKVSDLPDPWTRPLLLETLPDERVDKAMRIRRIDGRKQSMGAGLLLEHAKGRHGQDSIYNLSHSGDYVICSVSQKAVGCDIEKIKDSPWKVAERYFCESEVDYLKGVHEEERDQEFFRLWTCKESYTKMTGKGLSMGLKNFEVRFGCEEESEVSIYKDGQKEDCHIKEYKLEGYKVTVCAMEEEFGEELNYIELQK